ncbi:hypothetical protein [Streptomyces sp. TE33382]
MMNTDGYCGAENFGSYARCTQPLGHSGPHYDWRAPSERRHWPNADPDTNPHSEGAPE